MKNKMFLNVSFHVIHLHFDMLWLWTLVGTLNYSGFQVFPKIKIRKAQCVFYFIGVSLSHWFLSVFYKLKDVREAVKGRARGCSVKRSSPLRLGNSSALAGTRHLPGPTSPQNGVEASHSKEKQMVYGLNVHLFNKWLFANHCCRDWGTSSDQNSRA